MLLIIRNILFKTNQTITFVGYLILYDNKSVNINAVLPKKKILRCNVFYLNTLKGVTFHNITKNIFNL